VGQFLTFHAGIARVSILSWKSSDELLSDFVAIENFDMGNRPSNHIEYQHSFGWF
jgi:hypothetical protein